MKKKYIVYSSISILFVIIVIIIAMNFYLIFGRICYMFGSQKGIDYTTKKMGESGDDKYIPFIRRIVYDKEFYTYNRSVAQFEAEPMVKGLLIDAGRYAEKYGLFNYKGIFTLFTGDQLTGGLRYLLIRYKDHKLDNNYKPLEKVMIFNIWFKNNLPYLKRHIGYVFELRLQHRSDTSSPETETKYWEVDTRAKLCSVPYKQWKELDEYSKSKRLSQELNIPREELSKMSTEEIELKIKYELAKRGLDPIIYTDVDPNEDEITKKEWYHLPSILESQLYLMPEKYRPVHTLFVKNYDYSQIQKGKGTLEGYPDN